MESVIPGKPRGLTVDTDVMAARDAHQQKVLKLVAKGFYNELINYGINGAQVLTVAGHLLDNVIQQTSQPPNKKREYYNRLFAIRDIRDEWPSARRLGVQEVSLIPLDSSQVSQILSWLNGANVRESFYPPFPETAQGLRCYFQDPAHEYFSIFYGQTPVGIIGAENMDAECGKLEMKKLVGDPNMRGKGIGKRATFLFLYYVFAIRKFKKVYIHSLDINMRNINLNAKFGFELEGLFFEEVVLEGQRRDVVRMGLGAPVWWNLFSAGNT